MDYAKIRKRLSEQKGLALYDAEEIKYIEKPLGRASYTHNIKPPGVALGTLVEVPSEIQPGEPEIIKPVLKIRSTNWDRLKCEICGTVFMRGNRSKHKKTRHHRDFLKFNEKIRKIMLDG